MAKDFRGFLKTYIFSITLIKFKGIYKKYKISLKINLENFSRKYTSRPGRPAGPKSRSPFYTSCRPGIPFARTISQTTRDTKPRRGRPHTIAHRINIRGLMTSVAPFGEIILQFHLINYCKYSGIFRQLNRYLLAN